MKSGLVLYCLLAFAAAAPNPFGTSEPTPFGNDTQPFGNRGHQDIINGHDSKYGYFNYILLLRANNQFVCGASLISSTRGVTAAHCIFKDKTLSVVAGELDRSRKHGYEVARTVRSAVKHPSYVNYLRHNIAVLKFNSIPINRYIRPIPLLSKSDGDPKKLKCFIAGWGRTVGTSSSSQSNVLKFGHMYVITTSACRAKFGSYILDSHVCVKKYTYKRSSCTGDCGGPLECIVPNKGYKLLGVASFGRPGCPGATHPSVYTRVTAYESWIKSNM